MTLSAGNKLAHYEILELIGKGGMGEVYRAKDTKLGRDVAIKVLSEELSKDAERIARFQREAKVLASLNHPNIAAIYGLEQSDSTHYLVLELVEGETLAERIARGPIPFDEARELGIEIAEGLEEAHERGIVHRDLKPGNIAVTPDGKVKILDFGLAKALVEDVPDAASSMSPTLTRDATRIGVILGTAAYMSPEQARGKRVDRRTDVFAFGAVLYEMLTAKKAFPGDDISEVLAAVIKSEPRWGALPPSRVRELIETCLRKDVTLRLQHIGDARVALHDAGDVGLVESAPSRAPLAFAFVVGAFVIGALLTLALTWIAGGGSNATPETDTDPILTQVTANPSENTLLSASISPDGKYLAYVDLSGLSVRLLETGESHPVPVPADLLVHGVDWLPDSTTLILEDDAGLWKTSVFGGTPRRLASTAFRASVSSSGSIAYLSSEQSPSRRVVVTGSGGEASRVVVDANDGESFWELAWSPDGEWLLFGTWGIDEDWQLSIQAVRVEDGERKIVLTDDTAGRFSHRSRLFQNWRAVLPFLWTRDGRLIYGRRELGPDEQSSNLWTVPIEADATLAGKPSRLTQFTGLNVTDLSQTTDGTRLAFLSERNQSDVYVGRLPEGIEESQRWTLDERDDHPVGWIGSDHAIAFNTRRTGHWSLFGQAAAGVSPSLISPRSEDETHAEVSADGRWAFYRSDGEWMRVPIDGGPGESVGAGDQLRCNIGPKPRCLVGDRDPSTREYVFYAFDPLAGKQDELARVTDNPPFTNWDVSPDGNLVAIVHNDGRIRLLNLDTGDEREIALDAWSFGETICFAPDGRSVFIDGSRTGIRAINRKALLRVSLDANPEVETLRHRRNVWHVHPQASPDGQHLAFSAMTFAANAWLLENF